MKVLLRGLRAVVVYSMGEAFQRIWTSFRFSLDAGQCQEFSAKHLVHN